MLGYGINNTEAEGVVEGRANVEAMVAAEVPGYYDFLVVKMSTQPYSPYMHFRVYIYLVYISYWGRFY